MNLQELVFICLIILAHLYLEKTNKPKEHYSDFILSRATTQAFNCGECFYKKNKSQCEKSFTGKFCDTPCKWSKTIKHGADGTKITRHFCEEARPFYQIRKFW